MQNLGIWGREFCRRKCHIWNCRLTF